MTRPPRADLQALAPARAELDALWAAARAAYVTGGAGAYAEPIAQMRRLLRDAGIAADEDAAAARRAAYRERERRRKR